MTEKEALLNSNPENLKILNDDRKIPKQTWVIIGLCFFFVICLFLFVLFSIIIYISIPKIPTITSQESRKLGFNITPNNASFSATVYFMIFNLLERLFCI